MRLSKYSGVFVEMIKKESPQTYAILIQSLQSTSRRRRSQAVGEFVVISEGINLKKNKGIPQYFQ